MEALHYSRELQPYGEKFAHEISTIMAAIVSWPNKERYEDLFQSNTWQLLEEELGKALSKVSSPLPSL